MKTLHRITALLLLAGSLPLAAQTSNVPGTISYQGRVLTSSGALVGAGTPVNRTVIFRVWDSPSNTTVANLLYSEQQTVSIAEGEFSVLVGQGTATTIQTFGYSETDKGPGGAPAVTLDSVFNGSTRYLGVTVAAGAVIATTDNEITPRQQIVSTAFAIRAKVAEKAETIGAGSDLLFSTPAGAAAGNFGLGWYGTATANRPFAGLATLNGPVLYGTGGGALGSQAAGVGGTQTLALRWDATGNVGIGTGTSALPGGTNKLVLQGDDATAPPAQFSIRGNTDTNKRLLLGYNTTGNYGALQSYSGASTASALALNPAGGNVGIGRNDPQTPLDVNGVVTAMGLEARAIGSTPSIDFSSANVDFNARILYTGTGTDTLQFQAGKYAFLGSNFGIGTATPTTLLQVNGSPAPSIILTANNGAAGELDFGIATGPAQYSTFAAAGDAVIRSLTGKLHLQTGGAGAAITVNTFNQVGIGTATPNSQLVIRQNGGLTSTGQGQYALTFEDPSGGGTIAGFRRHSTGAWLDAAYDVNSTTFARLSTGGTWGSTSDRRMKKDVVPAKDMLAGALKLQPVRFHFNAEKPGDQLRLGFIAQDVRDVFPSLVTGIESKDTLTLDYATISVVAVGAVKELNAKVESKDAEIAALKKQLAGMTKTQDAQEARLARLEQALAAAVPPAAAPRKKVAAR